MKQLHPAFRPPASPAVPPATAVSADLATQRADYVRMADEVGGEPEPVAEVRDVDAGGVPARWYGPAGDARGLLVYLHGGGWVVGNLDSHDRVCRSLCNASGAAIVSVDYRLAPEHPFPAAVEDAHAALRWGAGQGMPLAVGGDSAGANLAAVLARRACEEGEPALRLQLLVYPVTDLRMESPSYSVPQEDGLLDRASMEGFRDAYLAGGDPSDPDVSPLHADDLRGVAPAFLALASHDVLRDEGAAYAARLREAGVPVTLVEYEDMAHGFARWGGVLDAARELHAQAGDALRAALAH